MKKTKKKGADTSVVPFVTPIDDEQEQVDAADEIPSYAEIVEMCAKHACCTSSRPVLSPKASGDGEAAHLAQHQIQRHDLAAGVLALQDFCAALLSGRAFLAP
jgi:hypothetical protein